MADDHALDLEAHLPFLVAVVSNLLRVDRDPLVRAITPYASRELRVLINVGSFGPVSAADVAYQARLDTHTVSRALKVLTRDGLVASIDDPRDRRRGVLKLTPSGEQLYARIGGILEKRADKLGEAFSPVELEFLCSLLRRLEDRAEEVLAAEIVSCQEEGLHLSADQKELLRWHRRGSS